MQGWSQVGGVQSGQEWEHDLAGLMEGSKDVEGACARSLRKRWDTQWQARLACHICPALSLSRRRTWRMKRDLKLLLVGCLVSCKDHLNGGLMGPVFKAQGSFNGRAQCLRGAHWRGLQELISGTDCRVSDFAWLTENEDSMDVYFDQSSTYDSICEPEVEIFKWGLGALKHSFQEQRNTVMM